MQCVGQSQFVIEMIFLMENTLTVLTMQNVM